MELRLCCWSWRRSTTTRRCQNPLNSLSRSKGPSAGRGTSKRGHSPPRPGSGKMSGTTCLSSGRCLHPVASFWPQPLTQTLRRNCKEKFTCLSANLGRLGFSDCLLSYGTAGRAVPPAVLALLWCLIPSITCNQIVKGAGRGDVAGKAIQSRGLGEGLSRGCSVCSVEKSLGDIPGGKDTQDMITICRCFCEVQGVAVALSGPGVAELGRVAGRAHTGRATSWRTFQGLTSPLYAHGQQSVSKDGFSLYGT